MRTFAIAVVAFLIPFAIVWIAQRVRKEDAPQIDSRVWFAGCVLSALTFLITAAFDSQERSGRWVETIGPDGRPVSVYRESAP